MAGLMTITIKPSRKEYKRNYSRNRLQKSRQAFIESQGSKCNYCEATGVPFDIDHIDRNQKRYEISKIWTCKIDLVIAELDKCQLLCKPCHRAKTRQELTNHEPTHGRATTYNKRGCRCDKCKAWNANRMKQHRAKAKEQSNG